MTTIRKLQVGVLADGRDAREHEVAGLRRADRRQNRARCSLRDAASRERPRCPPQLRLLPAHADDGQTPLEGTHVDHGWKIDAKDPPGTLNASCMPQGSREFVTA